MKGKHIVNNDYIDSCSIFEKPMASIIPKIKEVATISIQGIYVAQYCQKVFWNIYEIFDEYSLYSRMMNIKIKPKNNVVKNNIAVTIFLNFIRGICVTFPCAFSTLSNIYPIQPHNNPTTMDAIISFSQGISFRLHGP